MKLISKFVLVFVFLSMGLLFFTPTVMAHVLVISESGSATAVVHVNPDDDPIADSETVMFFDINSLVLNNGDFDYIATVSPRDIGDSTAVLAEEVGESGVRLRYQFPNRGVYDISLVVVSEIGREDEFVFSQTVSRGGMGAIEDPAVYPLAELGVVLSTCLIVVILILVINRRDVLAQYVDVNSSTKKT